QWTTLLEQIEGFSIIESTLNENESTLIISQKTTSNEILQTLDERINQLWLIFTKDDNNNKNSFSHILSSLLLCSNIKMFDIRNLTLDIICSAISVLLTSYKQFNNDSNLNIIASPFIGLARSLITEYERNRLKLIDLQTSLNNNNQSIFIHTLIEYMIKTRYSTDTCEVVLRLNDTNQNQVQHFTWHYEILQNNDEEENSKYEQISIIPKRDTDQKPFRLCVPQSRFLSELTWIEEDREEELLLSDMVD
ncbi:unnamed protein product, partial [Adineta steineri]